MLRFIPEKTTINFFKPRKICAAASVLLMLISIMVWGGIGLNTGIDFRGGFLIEAQAISGNADVAAMRSELDKLNLGDISLQEFGTSRDILIRVQSQEDGVTDNLSDANKAAIAQVRDAIDDEYTIRRTEFVGAVVGDELRRKALYAVLAAIGSILVYVWFRFEWPFAVAAILALSHDVVTTIGLFAIARFEFNLATIAALLTIAGYSINDTVVIFDRIRDNLRKYKSWSNLDVITLSLNQTFRRTVMTSVTTLIALLAIYFFGGAVLGTFALAMIWGVVIGTYSSIFVAAVALERFNLRLESDDHTPKPEYERDD